MHIRQNVPSSQHVGNLIETVLVRLQNMDLRVRQSSVHKGLIILDAGIDKDDLLPARIDGSDRIGRRRGDESRRQAAVLKTLKTQRMHGASTAACACAMSQRGLEPC